MDELRLALELANGDELQALSELLFRPKLNPLDHLRQLDPLEIQSLSRPAQLDKLENRLRYLAADGFTVLQGQSDFLPYRQILVQVCQHLRLPYSDDLSTMDLESEVFLHIMESAWKRLPTREKQALQRQVQQSIANSPQYQALPLSLQTNPMGLLAKGGSAVAISAVVRPWLLNQIARQIAVQMARHQIAKQTLARGGLGAVAQIHNRVAVAMTSRGMAMNAARYGAVRGVFSVLGPALWAWFVADLGWRAIASNYGRVIPAVFAIAQIRLTREGTAPYDMAQC